MFLVVASFGVEWRDRVLFARYSLHLLSLVLYSQTQTACLYGKESVFRHILLPRVEFLYWASSEQSHKEIQFTLDRRQKL